MAVPRNRSSNARKNAKRGHHAKAPINTTPCPNCGSPRLFHRICSACGQYKGKQIFKQAEPE